MFDGSGAVPDSEQKEPGGRVPASVGNDGSGNAVLLRYGELIVRGRRLRRVALRAAPQKQIAYHECAGGRGAFLAAAIRTRRPTTTGAAVDGSGTAVIVTLVRLLLVTTPAGGNNVTLFSSKLSRPRAVFVGRASLSNIGGGVTWLKSAWKDTAPPARGGKRAGASMLMSMACTAVVNVMWMLLLMPKSAGYAIVTSWLPACYWK